MGRNHGKRQKKKERSTKRKSPSQERTDLKNNSLDGGRRQLIYHAAQRLRKHTKGRAEGHPEKWPPGAVNKKELQKGTVPDEARSEREVAAAVNSITPPKRTE